MQNINPFCILIASMFSLSSCNYNNTRDILPSNSDPVSAIEIFSSIMQNNVITSSSYYSNKSPFKPTQKIEYQSGSVDAFDYGPLGHCFISLAQNTESNPVRASQEVYSVKCLMDRSSTPFNKLAKMRVFFQNTASNETSEEIAKLEGISLVDGYSVEHFSIVDANSKSDILVNLLVLIRSDLLAKRKRNKMILGSNLAGLDQQQVAHLKDDAIVKRVEFIPMRMK